MQTKVDSKQLETFLDKIESYWLPMVKGTPEEEDMLKVQQALIDCKEMNKKMIATYPDYFTE